MNVEKIVAAVEERVMGMVSNGMAISHLRDILRVQVRRALSELPEESENIWDMPKPVALYIEGHVVPTWKCHGHGIISQVIGLGGVYMCAACLGERLARMLGSTVEKLKGPHEYRDMGPDDRIQEGDEGTGGTTYIKVGKEEIGRTVADALKQWSGMKWRRPLSAEAKEGQ